MIPGSAARIGAIFYRYVILNRRSLVRVFDIVFWPVTELLIWGFITLYIQEVATGSAAQLIIFLIGALIAWDIHYRGQQAVTLSLMEEIWTKNIVNILIAPIRLWEWLAATFLYGVLKVAVVATLMSTLAKWLYGFEITQTGWLFLPLVAGLLLFGWAVGLMTAGLLVRFGYAAEALIWGIPLLIQPFSCVFYPMSSLPPWAQAIAFALPSTYAFEGLRLAYQQQAVPWSVWWPIISLNILYFVLGTGVLVWCLRRARATGRLSRLGQD